jgi:hypothetical protein
MGILYNVTLTPAMNDVSVTSGNADGWIYAVSIPLDSSSARLAGEQPTPRTPDRTSVTRRSVKASKRRRERSR